MNNHTIFIAYSHEDDDKAIFIHKCLNQIVQFQPYKAEQYPDYGKNFKQRIQKVLNRSHSMVVLLTNNGINSQWVNQEVGFAYALRNRIGKRLRLPHIIPISEKLASNKLKGFITKDTTDIIFIDDVSSFECIIARIIFSIRKNIKRGLEEGVLTIRCTCPNCKDESGFPFKFEKPIPSNEKINKFIDLNPQNPAMETDCPQCNENFLVDARTFLPLQQG